MQVKLTQMDVEALLAPDHAARAIWGHEFEEECWNRGERAGRPRWSPQVLISIWVCLQPRDGLGAGDRAE